MNTILNKEPIICGKPMPNLFNQVKEKYNIDLKRSCIIGDRLDTDIKMGLNSNIISCCVLTGVTQKIC